MYGGGVYFSTGPSLGGLLTSLIFLATGILKIVLIVSLIAGIVQVIRGIINDEKCCDLSFSSLAANKWFRLGFNSLIAIIVLNLVLSLLFGNLGFGGYNYYGPMH